MGKVKLCGVLTDVRGTFVDDNKINASGKHGVRVNPDGTHSLVQYSTRDLLKKPLTAGEITQRNKFKTAAALRQLINEDPTLSAQWMKRFREDATTKCNTFNGYIMSMALKGHINEDGSYKA